jgi:hypothetical protein
MPTSTCFRKFLNWKVRNEAVAEVEVGNREHDPRFLGGNDEMQKMGLIPFSCLIFGFSLDHVKTTC